MSYTLQLYFTFLVVVPLHGAVCFAGAIEYCPHVGTHTTVYTLHNYPSLSHRVFWLPLAFETDSIGPLSTAERPSSLHRDSVDVQPNHTAAACVRPVVTHHGSRLVVSLRLLELAHGDLAPRLL